MIGQTTLRGGIVCAIPPSCYRIFACKVALSDCFMTHSSYTSRECEILKRLCGVLFFFMVYGDLDIMVILTSSRFLVALEKEFATPISSFCGERVVGVIIPIVSISMSDRLLPLMCRFFFGWIVTNDCKVISRGLVL